MYAYAQQQQHADVDTDPLSSSLQIAQSKVQAATSPCTWGHGLSSLHKISTQDLLMMFRITSIGRVIVYLIVISMLNHVKTKEEQKRIVMCQ